MSLEMQARVQRIEAELAALRQLFHDFLVVEPDLRQRYKEKFGKFPHPAMNPEKLERLAG